MESWFRVLVMASLGVGCTPPNLPESTSRLSVDDGELTLVRAELSGGAGDQAALDTMTERIRRETTDVRILIGASPDYSSAELLKAFDAARAAGAAQFWIQTHDGRGNTYGIPIRRFETEARSAVLSADAASEKEDEQEHEGYANPRLRASLGSGLNLRVRDQVYDPSGDGLRIPCPTPTCSSWPVSSLNRMARRLKLDHPRDRAVMIYASDVLKVQGLVHLLDATRDDAVTARGTRTLFPEAILAPEDAP